MVATKKKDLALLAHLFRRAGFGATYEELEAYAAKSYEAAVEELINPEAQPPVEEDLIIRLNPGLTTRPGIEHNQSYWVYRMINTKRPLEEKIALFWHGVHCTGYGKVDWCHQIGITIEMFRNYGLGSFRELLVQLARQPDMVYYLDNNVSHKGAINENWGRELLELFSMGVGNYTEDDVKEAARAFTGWTVGPTLPRFPHGGDRWYFLYDPTDHDEEEKSFLGEGGRFNGEDVVDVICRQPASARFIARQLYAFFVADEAPVPQWMDTPPRDPELIKKLSDVYFESGYSIRAMLGALLNSDSFKKARFAKVKSPAEVAVGAGRVVKAYKVPGGPEFLELVNQINYMGQELFNPPTVEGWHTGQEWIDSGTLVERVNFAATQLGDVAKPGVREIVARLSAQGSSLTPAEFVRGCAEQLGFVILSDETTHLLLDHAGQMGLIKTGTEEFASRAGEMLQLIASAKEYQFG